MALIGKGKQYHWSKIQRRHFISTAIATKFPVNKAEEILQNMLDKVDEVITKVTREIPGNFPRHISQAIFEGMQEAKEKLELKD